MVTSITRKPVPKTVLVYEADWKEGGSLRNCLEACGYVTTAWSSFEDATKALAAHAWTLVITSTNLVEDFDRFVKVLGPMKVQPKVILIADADEPDPASRCFLQSVAVLNRPYDLKDLAELAETLIGKP